MQSCTVVVLVALVAAVAAEDYYPGKWNNVDPRPIVDNDRLFARYEGCILGSITTGCSQDALDIGRVWPEALANVCAKCSPQQQQKIRETLTYICQKRPEAFARILAQIDPEGKFRKAFEAKFGTIDGGC